MKKIIVFTLTAMMVFALAACGQSGSFISDVSTEPGASSGGASETAASLGDIDLNAILSGNGTDTVYGSLDPAQKQQIIDEAKKEGVDVSFGADGSMTIKDADGSVTTQKPDGTWSYKDANGDEGQIGGGWPDNEYTKLLPKPEFTVLASGISDGSFSVSFTGVTAEQMRAYTELLKSAGYTENAETYDQEYAGVAVYSYSAHNSAGYEVSLAATSGMGSLSIGKN